MLDGDNDISLQPVDTGTLNSGNNLLQTGFWGDFKRQAGWSPLGFRWKYMGCEGSLLVLHRPIAHSFRIAYIPYGPDIPAEFDRQQITGFLTSMACQLKTYLPKTTMFIRFDLTGGTCHDLNETPLFPPSLGSPLHKGVARIQPPDTVILSLGANQEKILMNMNKKTRYNIRLSQKKGVTVHRYSKEDALDNLHIWYNLYQETGKRDGISIHNLEYYRKLFQMACLMTRKDFGLYLYMAKFEDKILAGTIVAQCGKRFTYMYGASGATLRQLMPNHFLQWQAICDAVEFGADEYDLYGIPPTDDDSHPMHGLWLFKTGFGGQIHHYFGTWDYACRKGLYKLYSAMECHRMNTVKKRKNRI